MATSWKQVGLGFADLGDNSLHKAFWTGPKTSSSNGTYTATYRSDSLQLTVTQSVDEETGSFTEAYTFQNMGDSDLNLASKGTTSLGIYTPFNDHYTNTTDAMRARSHAHVWANGGSTAWVKLNQMGGNDRNLGLVVTKGSLAGYSIESRDTITSSNTRGVFLLHPVIPTLAAGDSSKLEWTLFWHDDWTDFFTQCASRSDQFIHFNTSTYTLVKGETATINMTGAAIDSDTTVNGSPVKCSGSVCSISYAAGSVGTKTLLVSTIQNTEVRESKIYLNTVPKCDDLIQSRANFIMANQQIDDSESAMDGAYAVYDNQAKVIASYDKATDRNAARERVGMGVLMNRWAKKNPDNEGLQESLVAYYNYVCAKLQDENGYVYDRPTGTSKKRLYNWPWVLQLHLTMAALDLNTTGAAAEKSPIDRFMLTLESFYSQGGVKLYAIGLPILEGLRALEDSGNEDYFERAKALFIAHDERIIAQGTSYPAFEVNFEQSIVAPASVILLELHRFTGNDTWLEAAEPHLDMLLNFAGRQPDYRLHDVAIRHWDGYWFGKDRMWGDVFPHYWSTLNAIAMHHYGKAIGDKSYTQRAEGVIRANLALFAADGSASCAWLYPLSVDSRSAHYKDAYANDQDWALAHLLQLEEDDDYDSA